MSAIQIRREVRLAVQRRESQATSYDPDKHTVDLTAATGTRVLRWSWTRDYYWEVLDISASAVDLGRVEKGVCPLLDSHSRWSVKDQLGVVTGARFDAGQLVLPVKFGDSDPARSAEGDVAAGNVKGVSIGYRITELTLTEHKEGDYPVYTATRWELLEVSLCPVPADPDAGVRSDDGLNPCVIITTENRHMDPEDIVNPGPAPAPLNRADPVAPPAPAPAPVPAPAADASGARMTPAEALSFVEDARAFGDAIAVQARTWATDMTPEAARSHLLRTAADAQRTQAPLQPAHSGVRINVDERDTMREAIASALAHRHDPSQELTPAAREWRGMSLLEMARRNLEENGEKVRGLGKRELADLALRIHSTSDFPHVLSNVAGATLRRGYEEAPQTFKAWQRRATAPDFKQISRLQLGTAPAFLLVPEGGAFKMGTIGEGKEVYALATYGRRFAITRQVLINDDLDAFTRIPQMFGAAAARFESDAAYAPLIANPNMADGVALFHATHGNLAGAGGAISESTLNASDVAMGNQVGIGGEQLNLAPKFLLVGRKDRVAGQKILSGIQATTTGDVNVFADSMSLIVESRLNRSSGATPWFTAADPSMVDTIEYAYLEGDDGVFMEERVGFEVDGMEFKARLDFGVKAIDHRGLYMNPGT
ncbi:prohead protease/major capsid protein fusion protein [Phenylobacterium sp.]|uniref:prohead protease/major capsid protein fusion protein n=1 Tax=Phenylobacterium sp. TaxID=1871053 RepID=UPI0027354DDB|nr:prohead protease/major capsid protein fusion protein [Phenylobacterium sp.]MDP3853159.1 HK97 family phage prohead protease [Phenylobacterium sp.]